MTTMFDTLLQLPLFQGLAPDDFTSILEKVKLDFDQFKPGEVIVESGQECDRLIFMFKGDFCATTSSPQVFYRLEEYFSAPYLVELSSLFGLRTSFVSTFVACTEVHTLSISKQAVWNVLFHYDICQLNWVNMLSNRVQVLSQRAWHFSGTELESRFLSFLQSLVERPEGRKVVYIKMTELAELLNDSRLAVSKLLNLLEHQGLLELHRGSMVIPDMALLLDTQKKCATRR